MAKVTALYARKVERAATDRPLRLSSNLHSTARAAAFTFALRYGRDPTRDDRSVDVGVAYRAGSYRGGLPAATATVAALASIAVVLGHGVVRKVLRLLSLGLPAVRIEVAERPARRCHRIGPTPFHGGLCR